MNDQRYDSRLVSRGLGTGIILAALALVAFAVPAMPTPAGVNAIALQESTITPTLTITATESMTSSFEITPTGTITPTLAPTSTPTPKPTPTGKDPEQAREPSGAWEFIDANSSLWFVMTDSRMKIEVWLDANGQKGLLFGVYAPEQKDLWTAKPIGQGTFNKLQPQHDYFWAGRTVAYGSWHLKLTNANSFPVQYNLNFDRVATRVADRCAVCHGYEIAFDGCDDRGSQFCEGLEEELKH